MADICATGLPADDAASVVPEHFFVRIHYDNDWSILESSLELILVVSGNLPLVADSYTRMQSLILPIAFGILSLVIWVVSFLHQWVHRGVCERIQRDAALATEVAPERVRGTVHKLLRWKSQQCSSCNFVVSFYSSSCRECPAWSAASLLNRRSDDSFFSPVDLPRKIGGIKIPDTLRHPVRLFLFLVKPSTDSTELVVSPITHRIDCHWEGVTLVRFDKGKVFLEYPKP